VVDEGHRASRASGAQDDVRLLERIRNRDIDAFEELYRGYSRRLGRFLMNLLRRQQLVEEVANDVMMAIWNRPDSYQGRSRVSTWIFGIAYRKALTALRKLDEVIEDEDAQDRVSPEATPEQATGLRHARELLLTSMSELPAAQRAVVDLTYFHEMGYGEIAQILDCPVDTVKTRMFHARRQLKRRLGGELSDWL